MNNVFLFPSAPGEADARSTVDRVLGLSPTALSYWDRDLRCRFANRACGEWLGLGEETLLGCDLLLVLDALHMNEHLDCVEAALQGEARTVVHGFHEASARRWGLVQYVPDRRGHRIGGVLIQISATPPIPQFTQQGR